jgi:hypothetical protein
LNPADANDDAHLEKPKVQSVEYTHPNTRVAVLAALATYKARALSEGDTWLAKRLHAFEGDVLGDHERVNDVLLDLEHERQKRR